MKKQETIRVLIKQENGYYVAQCLEYDVAAQGRTIEEVFENFKYTFLGHIALAIEYGEEPLANLKPAPDYYSYLYKKSIRLCDDFKLPEVSPMEGKRNLTYYQPKNIEMAVS